MVCRAVTVTVTVAVAVAVGGVWYGVCRWCERAILWVVVSRCEADQGGGVSGSSMSGQ